MDTLGKQAVEVSELFDILDDVGLIPQPDDASDAEVRYTYDTALIAIKLLLVSGKLAGEDLGKAMELAKNLE